LSDALRQLNEQTKDYTISFLYNELEDFRVTTAVHRKSVPDAIRQMIGFYPIRMEVHGEDIIVECVKKTTTRYKGTVIDEQGVPLPYANIALLSPKDSTLLTGGVSNESGFFVIPCEEGSVLARISYVGYKTIYKHCHSTALGTIQLQPDNFALKEVTVKGARKIIKNATDRLQYLVTADEFAKGLTAQELMRRVPLLQVSESAVSIVGKESTHYLLDGRELPDDMAEARLRTLKSENIERIEVITIPPSKYKAEPNAGYVNIVLRRDQTLGLRGDLTGGLHFKEDTNYDLNTSLYCATKKLDVSFSAGTNDMKGSNDHTQTTTFNDHEKRSVYVRRFDWNNHYANLMAKYQLSKRLDIGLLSSISTNQMDITQHDVTNERDVEIITDMTSPRPKNYNLSAELFLDWMIDKAGKMMTLTYDYLNNYAKQEERLASFTGESQSVGGNLQSPTMNMQTTGSSRYRIDAWKADFYLPFSFANIESGLHYTLIGNNSNVNLFSDVTGTWQKNLDQSNEFDYTEQTAAAYFSAWRQFGSKFSIKAGLRLEKTWIEGLQMTTNITNRDQYLYLFPTVHLGWQITDKIHLGAAYSKGISRPDFQYLNPFLYYTTPTNYFAGNPYLTPGLTDNMEINFNNGHGIYAVLYESHQSNALGTPTTFTPDGTQSTTVENCYSSDKTGLYVSWQRYLFPWWNVNLGGEVYYAHSHITEPSSNLRDIHSWSGKIEMSSDWFLNRQHSLILNFSYTHEFPRVSMTAKFRSLALLYAQLRYSLLKDRLRLSLSVSDPFHQNMTRSTSRYTDYTIYATNYVHPHSVNISATWSFGGNEVRRSYRQSKNTEASRASSR
ncbi:MAG: TonB-dependent receptor, partial [Prevotella sp.]|nr:TonB-dependent receptor [Prevotella sp.]